MPSKSSILEEILKIDYEINQLKTDTAYLKFRKNLKKLENTTFGKAFVTTPDPDNLKDEIKLRRRSKEIKDVILRYKDKCLEYEEKIDELYRRKLKLKDRLFG